MSFTGVWGFDKSFAFLSVRLASSETEGETAVSVPSKRVFDFSVTTITVF